MSDATISVQIRAVVKDLLDKLKSASSGTADAVEQMKHAFADLGHSTEGSKKSHEGLTGTLREFKAEQVQNARLARFYASSLMEIIPGAEGAKGAIQGLIGIGLEGFGMGAGIEATIFLFAQLKEHVEEHEKQVKALKAAYADTFREGLEQIRALQHEFRGTTMSKADDTWDKIIENRNKKLGELRGEIEELTKSSGVRQFFSGLTLGLVQDKDVDRIQQLRFQMAETRKATRDLRPQIDVARNQESAKEHADVGREIATIEAALKDEIVRIHVEKENKISEINRRGYEDAHEKTRLIAAIEQEAAEKIKRLKEDRELAYQGKSWALSRERTTVELQIEGDLNMKVAQLQHEYRDRKSRADQGQLRQLIQQEQEAANRRLEIMQAHWQKAVVDAQMAYQKMADARMETFVREDQALAALQRQYEDQRFGEQYANAVASIRAREQQESDIVRNAQRDRLISFEEMERMLALIHAKGQADRQKAYAQENQVWLRSFVHPLTSSFQSAIMSMLAGTKTLADGVKEMITGMLKAIVDGFVQMGVKALEESILEHAIHTAAAQASVTESAGVAGAAAAASTATIPLIGPLLAVEAGLAMAAAVNAAFQPMASAAGGYDIPAGVAPLTQLHPREMVLPEPLAEGARRTFAEGGGGKTEVHLHNAILDEHWWRANVGNVLKVLRDAVRLGKVR